MTEAFEAGRPFDARISLALQRFSPDFAQEMDTITGRLAHAHGPGRENANAAARSTARGLIAPVA